MSQLKTNYEIVSDKAKNPVTSSGFIKHGDKWLNNVIDNMGSYVTPEMFGAIGDGIHDDKNAIQEAFNRSGAVLFSNKTYAVSNTVYIKSNTVIYGNNATIKTINNTVLATIEPSEKNVAIYNLNFQCNNSIDCIGLNIPESSLNTDAYDSASNIVVSECSFDKGIFGIIATKASDIVINNCKFTDFLYDPASYAGGYGVLLQRCKGVTIEKCTFENAHNGRHDVYISCAGSTEHTTNCCRDIVVRDCYMNHETQTYYSPNTPSIMIRHSYNVCIENNHATKLMCLVATDSTQGIISGLKIIGNYITEIGGNYAGVAETKSVIDITGGDTHKSEVIIKNNYISGSLSQIYNFIQVVYAKIVVVDNITNGEYSVEIHNGVTIFLNNLITNTKSNSVLRFVNNDKTIGYIGNVRNGGNYANIVTANAGTISKTLFDKSAYEIPIYDGEPNRSGLFWFNPSLTFDSQFNEFTLSISAFATQIYVRTATYKPDPTHSGHTMKVIRYDGQKLVFQLFNNSGEVVKEKSGCSGYILLE